MHLQRKDFGKFMHNSIKTYITILFIACTINSHNNFTTFWDTPKHGANIFNAEVTSSIIEAAKELGIEFIRLAPDKFITQNKDFLFKNTDSYKHIDHIDLSHLKNILDLCWQHEMPVVLTFLSLPGSRWKQNNNNVDDLKLWQDETFQVQAAQFWQDLARELKGHPSVVGYNILNEPHPEKLYHSNSSDLSDTNHDNIQQQLFEFYQKVITKIREIDNIIPIIIDSSGYADPLCFEKLIPFNDNNILYSFHMYEPFNYTCRALNQGQYSYPNINWDKKYLEQLISTVIEFQEKHVIPSSKILVGEFGCNRFSKGINNYFYDLVTLFNTHRWHWAFYAFQEDTWDGMDYELGTQNFEYQNQKYNIARDPRNNIIFGLIKNTHFN